MVETFYEKFFYKQHKKMANISVKSLQNALPSRSIFFAFCKVILQIYHY